MKLLSQLITRYQRIVHAPKPPIPVSIQQPEESSTELLPKESAVTTDIVENIISSVPKSYQKYIHHIIIYLKNNGYGWNHKGEFTVSNQPLSRSNVIDLFSFVMRNRKEERAPLGSEVFRHALKIANIPLEWIGNKNIKMKMREVSPPRISRPRSKTPDSFTYRRPRTHRSRTPPLEGKWLEF